MISIIERVKKDIENYFPGDKKAVVLINDCLHHFCWALHEKENKENGQEQHVRN